MTNKLWGRIAFPALVIALASCGLPQVAPLESPTNGQGAEPQGAPPEPQQAAPAPRYVSAHGVESAPERQVFAQANVSKGIPTTSRCYTLSTERVIFKYFRVASDNRSDWDAKAQGIANTCDNGSRVWDDLWYYYTPSATTTDNILLVWKNIDRKEYGYVVVKNTPTVWLVYNNEGGPTVLANNSQYKRTWHSDGKRIDIDVFNPNNTGDWTANDIWVSFGY